MRRELIQARGNKTQSEVASEIGISQKYLSKLEQGKRNQSMVTAIKITKYYNKPVNQLFVDFF